VSVHKRTGAQHGEAIAGDEMATSWRDIDPTRLKDVMISGEFCR
jgi:hypothetical protein